MSRITGWFRTPAVKAEDSASDSDSPDTVAREMEEINDAMLSASLIMNDDIDGAWERLQTGSSSFHQLGLAVTIFMRSVLGFEKQVMTDTTTKLDECEAKATADFKKAQKHGKARCGSKLYPPGTEFELVRAETQLMGAVVGVLHESLIEAMKSFYKARKAFITLDSIIEAETKILGNKPEARSEASLSAKLADNIVKDLEKFEIDSKTASKVDLTTKDASSGSQTPALETFVAPSESINEDDIEDEDPKPLKTARSKSISTDGVLLENPLDVFVHSGANMCFGVLLLMLSLVPPSFSRILSVVGFRGDRERGVRMLWRSTAYGNVNGAIAGLSLLAYYNTLLGAVDILPDGKDFDVDAEVVGPPRAKCDKLLRAMRSQYPESQLWKVEEARQLANELELTEAIEILKAGTDSKMKQIAALNNFELSINAMFAQDWPLMRDSFLRCLEVNDWSPALYYYMAGTASVELYRDAVQAGDEGEARRQKAKAEEFLRKAPPLAGKKRFMARQLPFETFLQRKVQKWEERVKNYGVDLADAVGASPTMEMCYIWNGIKRMGPIELEKAIKNLSWDRCTAKKEALDKIKAEVDEIGEWALTESALLRRNGKFAEARQVLEDHILKHDRCVLLGDYPDRR